jgi:hypothetical protein
VTKLQEVANRLTRVVEVCLDDVEANLGDEMAERIERNAHRYKQLFADAIDSVMPEPTVDIVDEDVADVLMSSRRDAPAEDGLDAGGEAGEPRQTVPAALKRRYEVRLIPRTGDSKSKALPIRKVKADTIGHLVTVKGIVTRVSEVKPQLALATYTCDQGGYEVYQEVNGRSFMPLFTCPVPACCNKNGRLALQTRGSKFIKFQEVKIQEEASEVPTGHVPRSMTIHLCAAAPRAPTPPQPPAPPSHTRRPHPRRARRSYGELTRQCSAGDTVTVSGIFLPVPYAGWKALKAGLVTDTYLEASFVSQHKKSHVRRPPATRPPRLAAPRRRHPAVRSTRRSPQRAARPPRPRSGRLPAGQRDGGAHRRNDRRGRHVLEARALDRPRDLRPRGREEGAAPPPRRRRDARDARRDEDPRRHQRLPDGRPRRHAAAPRRPSPPLAAPRRPSPLRLPPPSPHRFPPPPSPPQSPSRSCSSTSRLWRPAPSTPPARARRASG